MALLGDDGRGYELARRLEACGVWRHWLGDAIHGSFVHLLTSPSSWESFMQVDDSKSRAQIQLQLRVRALLFDKATVSLFLKSSASNSSLAVSKLNPNYFQLHADDVYFTLDNATQDGGAASNTAPLKNQSKSSFGAGPRYGGSEFDSLSHRFGNEDLPETWYNQFMEKYRLRRPYKLSLGDRENEKRSPEEMATYIRVAEKHKRRLIAFPENVSNMHLNSAGNNISDEDMLFFPETMFVMNSVPDSALPPINRSRDGQKVEFHGVLDTLPLVTTKSPVMIERLGLRPEYLGMDRGGNVHRGKSRRSLSQEQASQLSRKVISRMLLVMGFEGATEVPLEVFSQLFSCHISKLGHNLKVLTDSYRKQCSAVELIKMFLHTAGYSNFGPLAELIKDGTRNVVQQTQQQIQGQGIQPQFQSQQQGSLRIPQQIPRQMHPQMQQMVHNQNLTFQQQQQLERMRRRQPATPRPGMDVDKERPLVQVKIEQQSDMPMDSNAFNSLNARHPQMQFRQQQFAAMSNLQAQSNNQFRQLMSPQIPQMQSPNMGIVRAPPVKVEGFSELMGGDASVKHDSEENRLTSPQSK